MKSFPKSTSPDYLFPFPFPAFWLLVPDLELPGVPLSEP